MARRGASAALLLCCAPLVACQRLLALTYYAPPSECWRYEKGANGEKNTDPPCAPKTDAVPYLWDWWAQQNAETDPLQTKTDPSDPQKRLPPDSRPTDAGTGVRVFKGSAAEEQYTALYPPATSNPPDFSVVWPLPDTDTQTPTPCACSIAEGGKCKWFVPKASRDLLPRDETEDDGTELFYSPDWPYPQYASLTPMVTKTGSFKPAADGGDGLLEFSDKAQSIVRPTSSPAEPGGCGAVLHDMLGAAKQCTPPEGGTPEPENEPVCVEDYNKCDDRPGQPCLVIYTHGRAAGSRGQQLALPSESTALETMSSRLRADYSSGDDGKDAGRGYPRLGPNPFIGANFLIEGRCSFGATATCDRACCEALAPPEHEVKAVLDEWRENKDHPAYVRKEAYDRFMKQRTAAVT